jgi:hypothetical protein
MSKKEEKLMSIPHHLDDLAPVFYDEGDVMEVICAANRLEFIAFIEPPEELKTGIPEVERNDTDTDTDTIIDSMSSEHKTMPFQYPREDVVRICIELKKTVKSISIIQFQARSNPYEVFDRETFQHLASDTDVDIGETEITIQLKDDLLKFDLSKYNMRVVRNKKNNRITNIMIFCDVFFVSFSFDHKIRLFSIMS